MTPIEQTLYQTLAAASAISAIVGSRIYATIAPQNPVAPFLVYSIVAEDNPNTLGGWCGRRRGFYQLDAYALTADAANQLSEATFNLLAQNGPLLAGSAQGKRADYEEATKLYRVSRDFGLWA